MSRFRLDIEIDGLTDIRLLNDLVDMLHTVGCAAGPFTSMSGPVRTRERVDDKWVERVVGIWSYDQTEVAQNGS